MIRSASCKTAVLLCVVLFAILIGCGGADKDAPVYDTAANPYGLPAQACDLLDAIEAGQLVSYDVITEAFGRLYLENQELLENQHWKDIITRLGGKFHQRADELIKNGVTSYSQAAGFYILASFSMPDDTQLSETAALFTAWKEMTERVDSEYSCSPLAHHLADRLNFIRYFVFGDGVQREFAEQYLVHQLLDSVLMTADDAKLAELSKPDKALLAFLKLSDHELGTPDGQFAEPAVNLIAYRLVAVAQGKSRLELYMSPQEELAADYRVQLSFDLTVSDDDGQVETETVVKEFDFAAPTGARKRGELTAAVTVIAHTKELSKVQIRLIAPDAESSAGGSSPMDLFPVTEIPCTQ